MQDNKAVHTEPPIARFANGERFSGGPVTAGVRWQKRASIVMWRISSTVNIEHRLKIDGGRPLFAWFDFRLTPSEDLDVTLTFARNEHENGRWEEAFHEGLNRFLNNRRAAGRAVGYTRIEIQRVISHPIDTDAHAVEYNMTRALEAAFQNHESNPESVV